MIRISWRKVILFSCLIGLTITAIRGFIMAQQPTVPDTVSEEPGAVETISVYDHRLGQAVALPLETYLVSVVAAEMPVSFHLEALKAQAVAARTYTLRKTLRGGCKRTGADICTDSGCCQAYLSSERMDDRWGKDRAENLAVIQDAVNATRGEVLVYGGELIEALYHSASGGFTENSEDAFSSARPYLVSVMSTNESGIDAIKEDVRFSSASFLKRVLEKDAKCSLTSKTLESGIEILKTSKSGRVLQLRLGGTVITGREARSLFGLNSTLFTLTVDRDGVIFHVSGYGHGVGMSQTGANSMGLGGKTYQEILSYYYQGAKIASSEDYL